jgi:hypothetical protein
MLRRCCDDRGEKTSVLTVGHLHNPLLATVADVAPVARGFMVAHLRSAVK